MRRFALAFLLLLVLGLAATAAIFVVWRRSGMPAREGMFLVPGLSGPLEIVFDQWGVPSVHARSLPDLAAAMGWLHANDRMTQLELGRRAASGRLAEVFGPKAVDFDRRMRTLRLRKTAERYVGALSPESKALLEAYAAGVNAWLRNRGRDLPPELRLLDIKPEPWKPVDSLCFALLMSRDLCYPATVEEQRFTWLALMGPDKTLDLLGARGQTVPDEVEHAAEECARTWKARRASVQAEKLRNGSNGWAIGASLSGDSAPIVANDPHLGLGLPCIWYQALLRAPDYEAAGATLPGLPIVVIGQGKDVAWSFTNSEIDTNDLFLEEFDPQGTAVRRGFGWSPILVEHETIKVKGEDDVRLEVKSSDVGPLLAAEPDRALPLRTLAWTAYTAFDPIAPFVSIARAKSVDEIPPAIAAFVAPVQNLIAADRTGGMLRTLLGRVPDRGARDGKLPAPGWDANAAWRGLVAAEQNPIVLRPADDVLSSANDDPRPPGYSRPIAGDFAGPWRNERIRYLVGLRKDWKPEQIAEMQTDTLSLFAQEIVTELPAGLPGDAGLARDALAVWDFRMDKSGTSALFAMFEHELADSIWGDEFGLLGLPPLGVLTRTATIARAMRGELDPGWYDDVSTSDVKETREQAIQRALTRAWRAGKARFGNEVRAWNYGAINQLNLRHPLGEAPFVGRFFDRGPYPVPGSATCIDVFTGSWDGDRIDATHGASLRFVADLADPDRSLIVIPGGQSGHPFDKHYDDQIALFLSGRARPLYWSANAIEEHRTSVVRLQP